MDISRFYGGASLRPRHRYLESAKECVEASNGENLEIVLLPPESGDQPCDSDEEYDDECLDEIGIPEETAGEVEIHGEEFEDRDFQETREGIRWKKYEELSLTEVEPIVMPDEIMRLGELPMFEIFSLFFRTICLISLWNKLICMRQGTKMCIISRPIALKCENFWV